MSINRDEVNKALFDPEVPAMAKAKLMMGCAEDKAQFLEGLVLLAEETLKDTGLALVLREVQMHNSFSLQRLKIGMPLSMYIETHGHSLGLGIVIRKRKKYIVVKNWLDKARHRYLTIMGWTPERVKEEEEEFPKARQRAQKAVSEEHFGEHV